MFPRASLAESGAAGITVIGRQNFAEVVRVVLPRKGCSTELSLLVCQVSKYPMIDWEYFSLDILLNGEH